MPDKIHVEYAELSMEFDNEMRRSSGLNFPEACFCGGHIHKLGMRSDLKACPLLSPKTKHARLAAIGGLLDAVEREINKGAKNA